MTELVWVAIITQSGALATAVVGMWRKLGRIDQQTTNSHAETDYPNMRDELSSVRETVEATAQIVRGHDRRLERMDRNLADLHLTTEDTEDTLDRQRLATARALRRAVEDRETALEQQAQALRAYVDQALADYHRTKPLPKDRRKETP